MNRAARRGRAAWLVAAASAVLGAASPGGGHGGRPLVVSYNSFMVRPVPAALRLDPFYRKYVDAEGIPIVSSNKVPDAALLIARDIVLAETAERPDIRQAMVRAASRVSIMAISEGTMDLPEQRDWKKPAPDDERLTPCERANYGKIAAMTDAQYWNSRARGMGGNLTSGAAENLLGVPGTRYFGENIFVHEFSHNVLSTIETVDPTLYGRVRVAYAHALANGLWKDDYAAVTVQEYWAEGTQFYFNSNKAYYSSSGIIVSDGDLERYDPALYQVLAAAYGPRHHIDADVFYMSPARFSDHPRQPSDAKAVRKSSC